MTEKKDECSGLINGICPLHGVEVERRRSSDKFIDELRALNDEHAKQISRLSSFFGQAKVIGIVASAIWFASFWFTHTSSVKLTHELDRVRDENRTSTVRISNLEAQQLVNSEKFIGIVEKLDVTNSRLSEIITILPHALKE